MISSDSKTKKLNINVYEHPDFNSGAIDHLGSTVDYDILIWNDNDEILAKKIGKVSKKNLGKSLSFDVPDILNQNIYFSLSLSVVIDGKKTTFITISGDNRLLSNFIRNKVDNGEDPIFFTSFNFSEEPKEGYTLKIITIEESLFEEVYLKTLGGSTIELDKELDNVEWQVLEAERAIRRLSSLKKESLGGTVVLDAELKLLEILDKSGFLKTVQGLVTMYETSGLVGVSEYRQRLYTNLKPVLDNLIIAKGRLEKIASVLPVRDGEAFPKTPATKG
jgi:hypothetical protein